MVKQTSEIIKAFTRINNKSRQEVAETLNINAQSLTNKYTRGSFSVSELIKIANLCNCELAFIDKNNNKIISFPSNDVKE